MTDETYGFEQARVRLEEIATQVKRKDTSLEKSLDLLEEGVRLANLCTEQIDHTQWKTVVEAPAEAGAEVAEGVAESDAQAFEDAVVAEPAAADADADAAVDVDADAPVEDADGVADDAEEPAGEPPYDQAAEV